MSDPPIIPDVTSSSASTTGPTAAEREQRVIDAARRQVGAAGEGGPAGADPTSTCEPPPEPRPDLNIEGYDVVRELQRGGQGVVYQAIQKSTQRKVAIKILLEGRHASRAARTRFEREVELAARLKHPNIVSVFHSGVTDDGRQFYVMDYVRGLPLNRYVQERRPPLEHALELFSKVCDAVQFAHQRGVIHRDLKPSNILVDAEGQPRLLDFGLAKWIAGPALTDVSFSQALVGTLPYMSPEQTRGNPDEVDTRTDIYALGVILYEMLTGHYPYPVAGHMAEILKHIAETPPAPPSRTWTRDSGIIRRSSWHRGRAGRCPIDADVQTVVLKALAKERERRYQSAGDLARDLGHYLRGESIEARGDSPVYLLKRWMIRHRGKVAAAAVIGVLATSFGAYAYQSSRQRSATTLVTVGRQMEDMGRYSEAISKYESALELNPQNFLALCYAATWKKDEYCRLPFADLKPDLLREAEVLCDRALALKDQHGIWNVKAVVLYLLGKLPEAEAACRKTLKLKPDFFYAGSNLAKVLALQQRFDEAQQEAEQAVQVARRVAGDGKYDDGVWRTLGTLQLYLGQGQALESLRAAERIDRNDSHNHLLLARLYLTLPQHLDLTQALNEAKCAVAFSERRDPRFNRILAQAHLQAQQYSDAAIHAQAAIDGGDEAAWGYLILAAAQARLNESDRAAASLRQARQSRPSVFDTERVIVTAEKELLWFDTREELEGLENEAVSAVQGSERGEGAGGGSGPRGGVDGSGGSD